MEAQHINLSETSQNLLVFDFYNTFKDRIRNATPLTFTGQIAASEFLTYAATKMYLCFEFTAGYSVMTAVANPGTITFYNIANAIEFVSGQGVAAWDTTAAGYKYTSTYFCVNNIHFSRLLAAQYNYMKFIGYRVTII